MSGRAPAPRPGPIVAAQHGLRLLRSELNREILVALASRGPMTTSDLVAWLLASSRTSLGERLEELLEAGVVAARGGRAREFALTSAGRGLVELIDLVAAWLASHPRRPLEPSSPLGWRAFGAAADSWRATILDWIVRRAPTPADVADDFPGLPERQLRGEIEKLVGVGVVELRRARGGAKRYHLTDWGRRVIGVIAAIACWEPTFMPDRAAPFEVDDGIGVLLGTLPLVQLPDKVSGLCSLTVEAEPDAKAMPRAGAVWAWVSRGRVLKCGEGAAPERLAAWASGPVSAWFAAVLDRRIGALRSGGIDDDGELIEALIGQLHDQLYDYRKR